MGGRRAPASRHLHLDVGSPVHRTAPEAKLLGLVAFVVVVALTPRRLVPVFAVDAVVLAAVVALARIPLRVLLGRLTVVAPFVAFAVLVPFVGHGDQIDVAGISLSVDGLWATWNILAKALLGATASIVVSATTPVPDLLVGMARLRVPAVLVAIVGFMFRYLDLLVGQLHRMRQAMVARGHDPRWLWQARPIAASAGALFVRSYERGERIHGAMLARGYDGSMPELGERLVHRRGTVVALTPAVLALVSLLAGQAGR